VRIGHRFAPISVLAYSIEKRDDSYHRELVRVKVANQANLENEDIELELLLKAIYLKYGYDFRGYTRASVKRRIMQRLQQSSLESISDLQRKILYDKDFFSILLRDLSINVTEMFRDPLFYKALREKIIPELSKLSFIKIWHAGCATGEEVYSMAILLKEEGLYDRTRLYGTDFDEEGLAKAKKGIYSVGKIQNYINNYKAAGGLESFVDYYSAKYEFVLLDKSLKENILFSNHNLVTDGVFGEMDMIVCRNVLIYFNSDLQNRVFKLFNDSLCRNGFLCLGSKETLRLSSHFEEFEDMVLKERIYRKR